MPGKLIAIGRASPLAGWGILGAALNATEAADMVAAYLRTWPTGRAVVAQAIRSFGASTTVAEDAIATVEP